MKQNFDWDTDAKIVRRKRRSERRERWQAMYQTQSERYSHLPAIAIHKGLDKLAAGTSFTSSFLRRTIPERQTFLAPVEFILRTLPERRTLLAPVKYTLQICRLAWQHIRSATAKLGGNIRRGGTLWISAQPTLENLARALCFVGLLAGIGALIAASTRPLDNELIAALGLGAGSLVWIIVTFVPLKKLPGIARLQQWPQLSTLRRLQWPQLKTLRFPQWPQLKTLHLPKWPEPKVRPAKETSEQKTLPRPATPTVSLTERLGKLDTLEQTQIRKSAS